MQKHQYELSVLVNGRPIREYGHRGLTFVEGRKNQPYTIKFRNNSARRVLAVVSIDGVDVVDGKPATQESRGYIVPAYSAVEIKGWRTSTESVHDFVFTTKPEGYSAQTQGDDSNSGVIAVKVFDEQLTELDFTKLLNLVEHHHHHHYHTTILREAQPSFPQNPIIWCGNTTAGGPGEATYSCCVNDSLSAEVKAQAVTPDMGMLNEMPKASQELPDFNLGTGWGEHPREDKVNLVDFKRGLELATMEVYYSDAEGLAKAGVEVDKKPAVQKPTLPKGFNGFCVPPKVTKTTA